MRDLASATPAQQSYVGADIEKRYFPASLPPNFEMFVQDITKPWPAEAQGTFDLVNQRFTLPAIVSYPTQDVIKGLASLLKPGGYLQLTEMDLSGAQGAAMIKLTSMVKDFLDLLGGIKDVDTRLASWMEEAGLEAIESKDTVVPVGASAVNEDLAKKSALSMRLTAEGLANAAAGKSLELASVESATDRLRDLPPMSVPKEELPTLSEDVEKEVSKDGGSWKIKTVWGRKPL